MSITTYPLNEIDYTAEDAALYNCTRTSGVYAGDDFSAKVTGIDNTITIGVGIAWMRLSRFRGIVSAMKEEETIELSIPDAVYPRIDVIAIRFDANANATDIVFKQGEASSNPSIPKISRSEAVYELYLYAIRREAGANSITASDITDLRMDTNYCGLMADSVTKVDLEVIYAQLQGAINTLNDATAAAKQLYDPYSLLRMESLWTSDSPESTFGEKTVELTVNPLEYTAVEILYNKSQKSAIVETKDLNIISSGVIPILNDEFSSYTKRYFTQISEKDYVANRYFSITETGISFENAQVIYYNSDLNTIYLEPLIPIAIYGFKEPDLEEGSAHRNVSLIDQTTGEKVTIYVSDGQVYVE